IPVCGAFGALDVSTRQNSMSNVSDTMVGMKTACLFALAAVLAVSGCKASAPGSLETSVATKLKQKVTIGGKDLKNPTPDTTDVAHERQEHFVHHCQI